MTEWKKLGDVSLGSKSHAFLAMESHTKGTPGVGQSSQVAPGPSRSGEVLLGQEPSAWPQQRGWGLMPEQYLSLPGWSGLCPPHAHPTSLQGSPALIYWP